MGSTSQVIRKTRDSLPEAGDRRPPKMRVVRFQHYVEDSTTGIPDLKPPSLKPTLFKSETQSVYVLGLGGGGGEVDIAQPLF